ncbi:hypothetical protein D9M68_963360 [compost metagenome]
MAAQGVQHDEFFRRRVGQRVLEWVEQDLVEVRIVGEAAQVQELHHVRFLGKDGHGRVELAERNLVRQPVSLETRFLVGGEEGFL